MRISRLLLLGGGGVRTPLVVFGINESAKKLDAEELVLYDIDAQRAEMVARLGREVVRSRSIQRWKGPDRGRSFHLGARLRARRQIVPSMPGRSV